MASAPFIQLAIGAVDGSNASFQTIDDYIPGTVVPFLNGQEVIPSKMTEVPPNTFVLQFPPAVGDVVSVYYVRV